MKRFIFFMILLVIITVVVRSGRPRPLPAPGRHLPAHLARANVHDRDRDDEWDDQEESHGAAGDVREALEEVRREIRDAWKEVRHEAKDAYREVRESFSGEKHRGFPAPPAPPFPPVPPAPDAPRLPVLVTSVDVDQPKPAAVKKPRGVKSAATAIAPADIRKVAGRISGTEDRARDDARQALMAAVREWLSPNVPSSWSPPNRLIDSMVRSSRIDPVIKDYGTLYVAELEVDTSPARRTALVNAYNRETVRHRLLALGGSLAFVLTCLAAFTGYVRADEATKGYYTNRLRTLVAAGLGAAGVVIYQMVA